MEGFVADGTISETFGLAKTSFNKYHITCRVGREAMDTKNPLEPPKDDYGPVRERRDFDPLQVCMKPILPCPSREFSFTNRTGWRYYPFVPFVDRLGSSRGFQEAPSTVMTIPESWQDKGLSSSKMIDSGPFEDDASRKRIQELDMAKTINSMKRQRLDDATLVTDGTFTNHLSDLTEQSNTTGAGNSAGATIVSGSTSSTNSKGKSSKATVLSTKKSVVVPKAAICALYGRKQRKTQLSSKQYLTWNNGAKSHEIK